MPERLGFDPYVMLGVSPRATSEDIKKAYREATHRFHPDANHHEGAALHFRDIVSAYTVLTTPDGAGMVFDLQDTEATAHLPRFSATTYISKRSIPALDEPQVVYMLMEISPRLPQQSNGSERHPINLALALDRSASMKGARLNRVKVAARQILELMGPEDRICIVSYSDRADMLIPSKRVTDLGEMRSVINTLTASGGTEIYQGLKACYEQVRLHYNRNIVNHIILLTDGRTYGDEDESLELANDAKAMGIGISAMGIGSEWNDEFLDKLASRTGGASSYISSPTDVAEFLEERVSSLGQAFAERLSLLIAPDKDVVLESVFRLSPGAQPLDHMSQPIPIGTLEGKRPIRILLQFQMPASTVPKFRSMVRMDVSGDILMQDRKTREAYKVITDQSIDVSENPPHEDPPVQIIDALSKITLYRMQQRVEQAVEEGDVMEATRRLQNLATRLMEMGQDDLATKARTEATRILKTRQLSEEGRKSLKFGTRLLLAPPKEPVSST